MKIDFREIEVKVDVEGTTALKDVCKELGNAIFRRTPDLGELAFAREIYDEGEVEIDAARAAIIRHYMEDGKFYALAKEAVYKRLDEIINVNK